MQDRLPRLRAILADGQHAGLFRRHQPGPAYMSIVGPILLNAARERAAAGPGRIELPMFVEVPHAELCAHMQQAASRACSPEGQSRMTTSCRSRDRVLLAAACSRARRRPIGFASRATSRPPKPGSRPTPAAASSTFTIREGDRVQAGQHSPAPSTQRDVELGARPRPGRTASRPRPTSARARRRPARRHPAGRIAGRPPPGRRLGRAGRARRRRAGPAALRDPARPATRARASSATMPRRGGTSRRTAWRPRRAGSRAAQQALARLQCRRAQGGDRRRPRPGGRRRRPDRHARQEPRRHHASRRPVSGIVTEKLVEAGEVIAPRTPVAVVADLDHAWADVFVPEPAVPRLRLGQRRGSSPTPAARRSPAR